MPANCATVSFWGGTAPGPSQEIHQRLQCRALEFRTTWWCGGGKALTPSKLNIAVEKWWLEDYFPFWDGLFSGAMWNFHGVPSLKLRVRWIQITFFTKRKSVCSNHWFSGAMLGLGSVGEIKDNMFLPLLRSPKVAGLWWAHEHWMTFFPKEQLSNTMRVESTNQVYPMVQKPDLIRFFPWQISMGIKQCRPGSWRIMPGLVWLITTLTGVVPSCSPSKWPRWSMKGGYQLLSNWDDFPSRGFFSYQEGKVTCLRLLIGIETRLRGNKG